MPNKDLLCSSILFPILLVLCLQVNAQKYTISGTVSAKSSGEKLLGVNIYDTLTFKGATSNNFGFYSLSLNKGPVVIVYSFVGSVSQVMTLNLTRDTVIHVELDNAVELEEVTITADKAKSNVSGTQMGLVSIPAKQAKLLPVILGEVDILKTMQLMPGIKSGTEGSSGIYVRGGGADQNLFLLDGVPIYNINHLFGFFSVFNADAIQNISVLKGGFPARYGGRLSSVVDIRMKEGNMKKIQGESSIGLISSKFSLEGPIIKDRSSFILSFRRTYFDLFTRPITKIVNEDYKIGYYFYDFNAKINYQFSDKSRIFLSAYSGLDKSYTKEKYKDNIYQNDLGGTMYERNYKSENSIHWGNITTALRWNYILSKKLFTNTTLTYSRYKFDIFQFSEQKTKPNPIETDHYNKWEYYSGINDIGGKIDFDFIPSPSHYIKAGINYTFHTFHPGITLERIITQDNSLDVDTAIGNKDIETSESFIYFEDEVSITPKLKANIGVHYSTLFYKSGFYNSLQPRVSARYLITPDFSIKASYVKMTQYINLLTNTTIGLPTDLWLPVTDRIKPQKSDQVALGTVFRLFKNFSLNLESYYKWMDRIIEYKEGASFFSQQSSWEDKITSGKGWSYGIETLLEKNEGKTQGWIGYTLAWTNRQVDEVNFGRTFPYRYDRRHDISVAITQKLSPNIILGVTWVYGTGRAITLAKQKYPSLLDYYGSLQGLAPQYFADGDIVEHYESRNAFREPDYHRLDFNLSFVKQKKWGERTVSIGLYNAYNRKNPFYLYYGTKNGVAGDNGNIYLLQRSFYTIMPSISYSVSFK